MNIYDQAHELARSMKKSEEYTEYMRLKEAAYSDSLFSGALQPH